MPSETIVTEISAEGVASVCLNRPEVHNAFDEIMIGDLTRTLRRLDADKNVRAVILKGNGKSFCAGADLHWMRRTAEASEQENRKDALALAKLLHMLDAFRKPTVARVHGSAYGGGAGIVACCDIAVAAEAAQFSFSEVRLGLVPAVISPYVVAAIGARQARRYLLSAERFSAVDAMRIGLVHEVAPLDGLNSVVESFAKLLLEAGPSALAETKALIARIKNRSIGRSVVEATAGLIAKVRASAEGREGVRAFLEKETPQWRK